MWYILMTGAVITHSSNGLISSYSGTVRYKHWVNWKSLALTIDPIYDPVFMTTSCFGFAQTCWAAFLEQSLDTIFNHPIPLALSGSTMTKECSQADHLTYEPPKSLSINL